jgi:hypothetical protein
MGMKKIGELQKKGVAPTHVSFFGSAIPYNKDDLHHK